MKKTLSTNVNHETERKLQKAADILGISVGDAIRLIVENGAANFFARVNGVH